jgi:hypothetical protein
MLTVFFGEADSLFEDFAENYIILGHAFFFKLLKLLQQLFTLAGQAGTFFAVGVHDTLLQVFFGGFNLAPDPFIGHFHNFGSLVDRAGFFNIFKDFRSALTDDDIAVLINNPIA